MHENVRGVPGEVGEQWQHLLLMFIIKDCENIEKYKEIENSAGVTATRSEMESLGGNPGNVGEGRVDVSEPSTSRPHRGD